MFGELISHRRLLRCKETVESRRNDVVHMFAVKRADYNSGGQADVASETRLPGRRLLPALPIG
jgi:hypothetical protein